MSKHFKNKHQHIVAFASELNNDLDCPGVLNSVHFDDETFRLLEGSQTLIAISGRLAAEIEWLYSGDINTKEFKRRFRAIQDEYETCIS